MRRALQIRSLAGLAALTACTTYVDVNVTTAESGDTDGTSTSGVTDSPDTSTTGVTSGPAGDATGGATDDTTDDTADGVTSVASCGAPDSGGDPMFPASCAQVLAGTPDAADGEYTLYINNNPARSWQAWCHDMDQAPAEYLILPMNGDGFNYAEYVPGAQQAPGTTVRTYYTRIRVDPHCFLVDTNDSTFSTSTGRLLHGELEVTSMPYGVAMDCVDTGSMLGRANVDLRGTPFTMSPSSWYVCGYHAAGVAMPSSGDQVLDLRGGGHCGHIGPGTVAPVFPCGEWGGKYLQLIPSL